MRSPVSCFGSTNNCSLVLPPDRSQVTARQLWHACRYVAACVSTQARLVRQLHRQQGEAASQDEWMDLAEQIDSVQGHDVWRTEGGCALYDSDRIQARVDELVRALASARHLAFRTDRGIGDGE